MVAFQLREALGAAQRLWLHGARFYGESTLRQHPGLELLSHVLPCCLYLQHG